MKNITFINAGAGSGKTYRLTQELHQAIVNGECKANEVLLTTFTKKAAEEIKIRGREKLLEENMVLEANDLQNAFIGTIHSVGSQIIQKFWHYIGFPREIKVMEDNDTQFYFSQAIANIPTQTELKKLDEINYRFSPRDARGNYNTNKWKEDLQRIIELARTNRITDFSISKNESLQVIHELLSTDDNSIDLKVISKAISDAIVIGESLPDKGNKIRKDKAKELQVINLNNVSYPELFKVQKVVDDLTNKGYDDGRFSNVNLDRIHRSKNLIDDIKEYNDLIFDLAQKSISAYEQYKKQAGIIDYSDMESGFLQLLDIEEVKSEIKDSVKLVMIDEFQDSNPIQLAIFIKLANIVTRSIWVGDPKQSIYGFRGTDPQLIEAIIKRFEKGAVNGLETDNLPHSWRSRPEIVNLVNAIFVPALRDQVAENTISLQPVRTNKGFGLRSALQHFHLVEEKPTNKFYYHAIAKSVAKLISDKWEVTDKKRSKPHLDPAKEKINMRVLKPSDIAILCKANDSIEAIANELKALGIKVASETSGLEQSAEFQLVMALIKLVLAKGNNLAKATLKVLTEDGYFTKELIDDRLVFLHQMPPFPSDPKKSDDCNDQLHANQSEKFRNKVAQYYKELNQWGEDNFLVAGLTEILQEIRELPVPQLLEQLINRLNLYEVVAKWGNAEHRRGNLQKLISSGYSYDERCINMNLGASLLGYVQYLDKQEEMNEAETKSDDAVNLLTYHRSKGLEWPIVFVAEFQKDIHWGFINREVFGINMKSSAAIDLNNILDNRFINLLPWAFGTTNTKVCNEFQENIQRHPVYQEAEERHHNEHKRLMYVGMTRPRDYLVTTSMEGAKSHPWINMVNHHDGWNYSKAVQVNIEQGNIDIFGHGINAWYNRLKLEVNGQEANLQPDHYFKGKNITKVISGAPYYISPSEVVAGEKVAVTLQHDFNHRLALSQSLAGKEEILGNCLHDIFYLYMGYKLSSTHSNIEHLVAQMIENFGLTGALDGAEIIASMDNFFNYLNSEFKPVAWYRELPLEMGQEQQLYTGEIDLLLETTEGYILIDYKSFPGDFNHVVNPDDSHFVGIYAGQLKAYKQMVEGNSDKKVLGSFIYYTVLGKLMKFNSVGS
ncbi:MAG: UvrD-helicase domain-containing protein [Marinilabiliaceae bacterium]|nr:UvrD-helicase domain-containing protein [Marinilabiliaceae bacterium]